MNPENADHSEERLSRSITDLDVRLAGRGTSEEEVEPELPPDELELYRFARATLRQLEQVWPRSASPPSPDAPPKDDSAFAWVLQRGRIGKYHIHRELGRGSGGIVFLATNTTTGREVALKLAHPQVLFLPDLRERFLREARLTLDLDHPNLVEACEADEVEGFCYLALAYTGEVPLTEWLEASPQRPLPRTAAALVAALARAVDYLHDRQILHRDIKPGNVLLSPAPAAPMADPELEIVGVPRLTDLGLAKVLSETPNSATHDGATGSVLAGTPEYMAPEQVDSQWHRLGRPTDVYGLGALLYALLVGHPPFQGGNHLTIVRQVLDRAPVPPRKLRKDVPRALEAICLTCLQKNPHERYATARELADDLRRFLDGKRPRLHPAPLRRRLRKWVGRPAVKLGLLLTAVILGGAAAAVIAHVDAAHQKEMRRVAAARQEEARRLNDAWQARAKGEEFCKRGEIGIGMLWFARALVEVPESAEDLQELLRLDLDAWRVRLPNLTATLTHADESKSMRGVQFSPDGRTLLAVCGEKTIRFWDTENGLPLPHSLQHSALIWKARYREDSQAVHTVCADGCIQTWCLRTGAVLMNKRTQVLEELGPKGLSHAGQVDLIWEFEIGERTPHRLSLPGQLHRLTVNTNRQMAVTVSRDYEALLWETAADGASPVPLPHKKGVRNAAFTPHGDLLLSAGNDGRVRFWKCHNLTESLPTLDHPAPVHAVAVDPTGRFLATGDANTIRLWDATTREFLLSLPGQQQVGTLTFSPDGNHLASGHSSSALRLWKLPERLPPPLVHPLADRRVQACPDGLRRAPRGDGILAIAYTPDGKYVLAGGPDDALRVWDPKTGICTKILLRHANTISALAVHPNGRAVLTGSLDCSARLWNLTTGQPLGPPLTHPNVVRGAGISPQGDMVATGFLGDGPMRLWDARTGLQEGESTRLGGVFDLTFSPDGQAILAGSSPDAYWHDRRTGKTHRLLHNTIVMATAFHPKGQMFVTGTQEGELRWWDAATLESQGTVQAHGNRLRRASFSPTGEVIATIGSDERLLYWHSRTRKQVGSETRMPAPLRSLAFHPEDGTVVVGCLNDQMHFAHAPQPLKGTPGQLLHRLQMTIGMELDAQGMPQPLTTTPGRSQLGELHTVGTLVP